MKSAFVPVNTPAVPTVNAAAAPEGTIAASAPNSFAIRFPTASCNSSNRTNFVDIAAIARTHSGRIKLAVIIVYTPAPLMIGATPSSAR